MYAQIILRITCIALVEPVELAIKELQSHLSRTMNANTLKI